MTAIRGDEHLSRCNGWALALAKGSLRHLLHAREAEMDVAFGRIEDTPKARDFARRKREVSDRLHARAERLTDLCAAEVWENGEGA